MSFTTTFHRDGTVTVWNVYTQQWQRLAATAIVTQRGANTLMPTLTNSERARIERMAARAQ